VRRIVACSALAIALFVGLMTPTLPWWAAVVGAAILGPLVWRLSQCPHPGPLALLPATTDLHGVPLPPRWYCDRCERNWPANFEKVQTPVQRFSGHDESKAVGAAKRAAELADRQRALALQRAGLRPATKRLKTPRAVHVPEPADVVQIGHGRRLA
jgi:hypothetical protein